MRLGLSSYRSIVFDCDGVILDSNRVKSEAFHSVATRFGADVADRFLAHHRAFGGVSRYVKFRFLVEELLGKGDAPELVDELLAAYAHEIARGLAECAVAPRLSALRAASPGAIWSVASGGDQAELRALFARRRLSALFDGGIHGSPETKLDIVSRLTSEGVVQRPGLFLGDSVYDWECASSQGLDFVFVAAWSELPDWRDWCGRVGVRSVATLADLLESRGAGQ